MESFFIKLIFRTIFGYFFCEIIILHLNKKVTWELPPHGGFHNGFVRKIIKIVMK